MRRYLHSTLQQALHFAYFIMSDKEIVIQDVTKDNSIISLNNKKLSVYNCKWRCGTNMFHFMSFYGLISVLVVYKTVREANRNLINNKSELNNTKNY